MVRTIRKRPRPKPHEFYPILSRSHNDCEHCDMCNECMEKYAEEAENARPGHVWRVEDSKIIYMEDDIMERHLGRKLNPTETVVHKNGKPKDNRFKNLEVVSIVTLEEN